MLVFTGCRELLTSWGISIDTMNAIVHLPFWGFSYKSGTTAQKPTHNIPLEVLVSQ